MEKLIYKIYEIDDLFYIRFEEGELVINKENKIVGFDFENLEFVKSLGIELDMFERINNNVKLDGKLLINNYKKYFNK